jgi:hypothetical protein
MNFINKAIRSLYPNATTIRQLDGVYSAEDSNETVISIDMTAVEAKAVELEAAEGYKAMREYPSIQEQLDMLYWDGINGTTNWSDAITAVKEANPKPSE